MDEEKKYKPAYEITDDNSVVDELYGITPEIKELLMQVNEKVKRKKISAIGEINALIKKYPYIPHFKVCLFGLYQKLGNAQQAREINNWIVNAHPDFLQGKINRAMGYIDREKPEKVPDVLGETMELDALYPDRKVFHRVEVIMFTLATVNYYRASGNIDEAVLRYEFIKEISKGNWEEKENPDDDENNSEDESDCYRSVDAVAKRVAEPTDEKPVFIHPEIEQLYCNSMLIDRDIVREILALPRETLIQDLNKALYDSIARFDYFYEQDYKNETHKFPFHAIFLLGELKAEESLQVVLDILRQDEKYFDLWFADSFDEIMIGTIFLIGLNKLGELSSFMKEQDRWCFARSVITDVISRMAVEYPERKNEAVIWFRDIINFCLANIDDDRLTDSDFNGLMICSITKFNGKELIPEITELFNRKIVDKLMSDGGLDCVLNELGKLNFDPPKYGALDIFSRYESIIDSAEYKYEKSKTNEEFQIKIPDFSNKIIEELFVYDVKISHDILKAVLELPRGETVPDLHKLLDFARENSLAYSDYYYDEWKSEKLYFPFHALCLLAEMQEEKSLETILNFLSLEEKFLEFWLGDFISEEVWKILLKTGKNRLNVLADVVLDPKYCQYIRTAASQAIAQTALNYPEKREEVIACLKNILSSLLQHDFDNDDELDEITASVVCDIVDIKADGLLYLIKECYDKNIVADDFVGEYDIVERDIINLNENKHEIKNIFSTYLEMVNPWSPYKKETDNDTSDNEDITRSRYYSWIEPVKREEPKIGRNDPCPCGSGKKYKKCCLKE